MLFCSEFTDASLAIVKEKQLKNWSRAKKQALISGKYENLPNLVKKKFQGSGCRYNLLPSATRPDKDYDKFSSFTLHKLV